MRPGEFDELIRQKFDQGDFAFDPANWERMAGKLDGQKKKKSVVIWWLPLTAIAAAVTVSMGFATYMQYTQPPVLPAKTTAAVHHTEHIKSVAQPLATLSAATTTDNSALPPVIDQTPTGNVASAAQQQEKLGIDPENILQAGPVLNPFKKHQTTNGTLLPEAVARVPKRRQSQKIDFLSPVEMAEADQTDIKKQRAMVAINGGVNYASKNSGFSIGATGRKMISDRMYVESDIALTGTGNSQRTASYAVSQAYASSKMSSAGSRTTTVTTTPDPYVSQNPIEVSDKNFNMYYAQVTPTLGYQVFRRMSLGVGPDFQQALSDNRPAPAVLDKNNVQVNPLFDIGFMGKAEVTISHRVHAALFYRQGINNLVTPMDKYIDRNYMQFQLKYTVFNKVN